MNVKEICAGGVPGETYAAGLRRRSKSIAIVWAFSLVSLAVTYAAFVLSASVWVTSGVAVLCGVTASRADVGFDPPQGDTPNKSDKLIWLILFVPTLVLLGAASIYAALNVHDGLDVFGAGLVAGLFGWVLGSTAIVILGAASRAHE